MRRYNAARAPPPLNSAMRAALKQSRLRGVPQPAGALFAVELPPEFPPGLPEPGFAG